MKTISRMTIIYLYFPSMEGGSANTFHLCEASSVKNAQRKIDKVLEAEDMKAVEK